MRSKWEVEEGLRKHKSALMVLARKNFQKFLETSVRVVVPYTPRAQQRAFRFSDVHSYNYEEIKKRYSVSEELNASLVEHAREFIAMEYPTDVCIEGVESLIRKTESRVVVSLIGERCHWESDFLRGVCRKVARYTAEEFLELAEKAGVCLGELGYKDPRGLVAQDQGGFSVEIHEIEGGQPVDGGKEEKDGYLGVLGGGNVLIRINCLCWKDKVPLGRDAMKMLDTLFLASLRVVEKHEQKSAPVIVHCLAGVGRTGSFIFYHMLRNAILRGEVGQEALLSSFIDLFLYLRTKRTWMVEAVTQLEFLYDIFLKGDPDIE